MNESPKFKGKYRGGTVRLANWDYAASAWYFVTICTHRRRHFFGEIVVQPQESQNIDDHTEPQNIAVLRETRMGQAALDCWDAIPEHFPFVVLDAFIVMPNHIHGLLYFDKPNHEFQAGNKFGPQSQNLASVMRGYKTGVTNVARYNDIEFDWQEGFHEHVVRNEAEFNRIQNYIINNPQKWADDCFNDDK
jgi:REP element-mobilizing transposase RayT